jgi:ParB-like chromosome segregation protein Spo0J
MREKARGKRFGTISTVGRPDIRTMDVSDLKPAPYNPRRIDPAAMHGLTKSLERFGDVQPIVWNKRSGLVVGGHQRLKILKSKKVNQTTVVVVDLDVSQRPIFDESTKTKA